MDYTSNLNLYKWNAVDKKKDTVAEMAKNMDVIDAQLAQNMSEVLTTVKFNDLGTAPASVNTKVVKKVSANEYQVFSRKKSRSGFTCMRFRKGIGANADAGNYGGTWDLLRLDKVTDLSKATAVNIPSAFTSSDLTSDGADFRTIALAIGDYTNGGESLYISNNAAPAVGQSLEFTVDIKKSNGSYLYLGFYSTGSSASIVNAYVGGVKVKSFNLSRTTAQATTIAIPTNGNLGETLVKLEIDATSTAGYVHFIGYNFLEINELSSDIPVNWVLFKETSNHYISASSGANEYALMEKSSGKWCGSYHGGETSESLEILLDGVDLISKNNGTVYSGKNFQILQLTNIIGKIKSHILTEVTNDSTYSISVRFEVTTPFLVNNFYIAMSCSNPVFSNVVYPINAVSSSSNVEINTPNIGRIVQMNPTTKQTITTLYTPFMKYSSGTPLYIQYSIYYAKVYHGLAKFQDFELSSMNFGNKLIFD